METVSFKMKKNYQILQACTHSLLKLWDIDNFILIDLILPLCKKNTILIPGKIKLGSVEVVYLK